MMTHDEPWLPPKPADGQYWLCLSEIEVLSLVEGIVLARTQQQARHVTIYLRAEMSDSQAEKKA
jgi:hypothetical protein